MLFFSDQLILLHITLRKAQHSHQFVVVLHLFYMVYMLYGPLYIVIILQFNFITT